MYPVSFLKHFLKCGPFFKVFTEPSYNIASALYVFVSLGGHRAWGISALPLVIEPVPPALEADVSTAGPPGGYRTPSILLDL